MSEIFPPEISIKVIAVAFVITTVVIKPERSRLLLNSAIALLISSAVIHTVDQGISGLLFSAGGAGLAGITLLPLYLHRKIGLSDLLITLTAGAIMGIRGYIPVMGIACLIILLQWLLRANRPLTVTGPYYSSLDHLDALKMDRHEDEFSFRFYKPPDHHLAGPDNKNHESRHFIEHTNKIYRELSGLARPEKIKEDKNVSIMPWRMKVSLATLAVLIIGILP